MKVPAALERRVRMFKERAHAWQADSEIFRIDSWTHVMLGQGIRPKHYHHLTHAMSDQDLTRFLSSIKESISRTVAQMPSHQEFLDQYCKASSDIWGAAPMPQKAGEQVG